MNICPNLGSTYQLLLHFLSFALEIRFLEHPKTGKKKKPLKNVSEPSSQQISILETTMAIIVKAIYQASLISFFLSFFLHIKFVSHTVLYIAKVRLVMRFLFCCIVANLQGTRKNWKFRSPPVRRSSPSHPLSHFLASDSFDVRSLTILRLLTGVRRRRFQRLLFTSFFSCFVFKLLSQSWRETTGSSRVSFLMGNSVQIEALSPSRLPPFSFTLCQSMSFPKIATKACKKRGGGLLIFYWKWRQSAGSNDWGRKWLAGWASVWEMK